MKLSVIIPSFYPAVVFGGTIFSSLHTCENLSKIGWKVFVSTTNTNMHSRLKVTPNKFLKNNENFYVKYYQETIVNRFSFAFFKGIRKDIKDADVVHVQAIFNLTTPISLLYASSLKKPILLSPRGVLCDWIMNHGIRFKYLWLKLFIKPFINRFFWHATSQQEKQDILYHFPNANVFVIPNGIDISQYSKGKKLKKSVFLKKYGISTSDNAKIIVSMGRLHEKKGFDILIKSFKEATSDINEVFLLIAGDDEGEKENLLQLVSKLKLNGKVVFIGGVNGKEKADFLCNADLFVLPSHNENFGNVYAEALASGTPIVASTHTPWEAVEEHNCGKWVDNTVQDTTEAIKDMLSKDLLEMGENGKEYIKKFDWQNIAKSFDEIYLKILQNIYE